MLLHKQDILSIPVLSQDPTPQSLRSSCPPHKPFLLLIQKAPLRAQEHRRQDLSSSRKQVSGQVLPAPQLTPAAGHIAATGKEGPGPGPWLRERSKTEHWARTNASIPIYIYCPQCSPLGQSDLPLDSKAEESFPAPLCYYRKQMQGAVEAGWPWSQLPGLTCYCLALAQRAPWPAGHGNPGPPSYSAHNGGTALRSAGDCNYAACTAGGGQVLRHGRHAGWNT